MNEKECFHNHLLKYKNNIFICKKCCCFCYQSKNKFHAFIKPIEYNLNYEVYFPEIINKLKEKFNNDNSLKFNDLYKKNRIKIVNYLKNLSKKNINNNNLNVFYLSMTLIDKLNKNIPKITNEILDYISCSCFILSRKFIDIDKNLKINYNVFKTILSEGKYLNPNKLREYETFVLQKFSYNLLFPSTFTILNYVFFGGFIIKQEIEERKEIINKIYESSIQLLNKCLENDEISENFSKFQIVFSVIFIIRKNFNLNIEKSKKIIKKFYNIHFNYYEECVNFILKTFFDFYESFPTEFNDEIKTTEISYSEKKNKNFSSLIDKLRLSTKLTENSFIQNDNNNTNEKTLRINNNNNNNEENNKNSFFNENNNNNIKPLKINNIKKFSFFKPNKFNLNKNNLPPLNEVIFNDEMKLSLNNYKKIISSNKNSFINNQEENNRYKSNLFSPYENLNTQNSIILTNNSNKIKNKYKKIIHHRNVKSLNDYSSLNDLNNLLKSMENKNNELNNYISFRGQKKSKEKNIKNSLNLNESKRNKFFSPEIILPNIKM